MSKNKKTPAKDSKSSKNQSKIDKQIKLEEKPLQLSFKDNLRKKITYFKSNPTFKFNKLTEEDEQKLKDCLSSIENSLIELNKNESSNLLNEPSTSLLNESSTSLLTNDQSVKTNLIKDKTTEDQLLKDESIIDKSILDKKIEDESKIDKSTDKVIDNKKLLINKFRNTKKEEKKLNCKKYMEIIKNEFVFGFNEIVRKLKTNQLIGIILSFKLTSHIQQTILELAFNHNISVLIVNDIEFYQTIFKISTISCLALLKNTNQSIFDKFNQTFLEIDKKLNNLNNNQILKDNILDQLDNKDKLIDNQMSIDNDKLIDNQMLIDNDKLIDNKINQNNEIKKNKRLKINPISIDDLWILKSEIPIKMQPSNLINMKTEFNKSDDLLILKDDKRDEYFPDRYLK